MPRSIDPFRDKRRKTSNGGSPKQAQKKKHAKLMRQKRKTTKTEEKLKEVTHDLNVVENRLERKKLLLEALAEAPTVAQQRKMIFAMFEAEGVNPLQIMMEQLEKIEEPEKKFAAAEKLASFFAPKPKSVDIQADVKSNLNISVMDFSKTTQKDLKEIHDTVDPMSNAINVTPVDEVDDDEYAEFKVDEDFNTGGGSEGYTD